MNIPHHENRQVRDGRLDRTAPARVLGAVALAVIALAGCGSSDSSSVQTAVRTYLSALADGDGAKACDQLSGTARREVAGGGTCAQAIAQATADFDPDEKAQLRNAKLGRTVVHDRKRECSKLVQGLCNVPTATVQISGSGSVHLEQDAQGDWLISKALLG